MANSTNKVGNLKGPRGTSFTTGNGAPSAAVIAAAQVGDVYLDYSTGDLYTFS